MPLFSTARTVLGRCARLVAKFTVPALGLLELVGSLYVFNRYLAVAQFAAGALCIFAYFRGQAKPLLPLMLFYLVESLICFGVCGQCGYYTAVPLKERNCFNAMDRYFTTYQLSRLSYMCIHGFMYSSMHIVGMLGMMSVTAMMVNGFVSILTTGVILFTASLLILRAYMRNGRHA
ncbi:hypothetical protein AAVH_13477 [Aphelenchoides avenae]|nr:hypothetical protein AAVH_13477 [Aphelenchus avenae]